jgi:hypothetical protein
MKKLILLLIPCLWFESRAEHSGCSVAGTASASADSVCENTPVALILTGYQGSIQWQGFNGTIWQNETGPGATSDYYTVTLTSTRTFRAIVTELNCPPDTSNEVTITVGILPTPIVTGATRCGYGQVTLSASGVGQQRWFTTPTGGTPIFIGNNFTTTVGQTTTFYVESLSGTGGGGGTMPLPAQVSSFSPWVRGFYFTAPIDFTITALHVAGSGNQSIAVVKFIPPQPPPAYPSTTNNFVTLFVTQNNPSPGPITVNIPIVAGEIIAVMGQRGGIVPYGPAGPFVSSIAGIPVTITRMGMQYPLDTTLPQELWSEQGGSLPLIQVTYTEGCTSVRVPVTATVTPADPVFITATSTALCLGQSTTLTVTSNNPNYVYQWSPSTGLSGTTGTTVTAQPVTTITYSVIGNDGTCADIDSITISVGPPSQAGTVSISSDTVCSGSPVLLTLTGSVGSIQWQSNTGSGWINETGPGSNSASYTAYPSVNTSYQAVVTSGGCAPATSATVSVAVIAVPDPVTVNDTLCGAGTAQLIASGTGTLYWYNSPTGGTPIATGTTFNPQVNATTTYYVEDVSGATYSLPPANPSIGTQSLNSSINYGLQFNVSQQATIEKVTIEPAQTGNVTINLRQTQGGPILNSVTVPVTAFQQTVVNLGFSVNPGIGYRLELAQGSVQCYYNSTGASYPYTVPNSPITITGYLNPGPATGVIYYYFYNWQVMRGCRSNRVPVSAVVYPAVPVPVITQNGNQLISSSPSNNQWYLNGNPIPGATGQTYIATQPGSYTVVVTDPATGCSAESLPVIITGIYHPLTEGGLTVFPNPVTDRFFIQSHATGMIIGELSIRDIAGRLLNRYSIQLNGNQSRELSFPYVPGVYMIELIADNKTFLTRLVKE